MTVGQDNTSTPRDRLFQSLHRLYKDHIRTRRNHEDWYNCACIVYGPSRETRMLVRFRAESSSTHSDENAVLHVKIQRRNESQDDNTEPAHEFTFKAPRQENPEDLPAFKDVKPTAILPVWNNSPICVPDTTLLGFLTSLLAPVEGVWADLLIFDSRIKPRVPDVDAYIPTFWYVCAIEWNSLCRFKSHIQIESNSSSSPRVITFDFEHPRIEYDTESREEVILTFPFAVRIGRRCESKAYDGESKVYDGIKFECPCRLSCTSTNDQLSIRLTLLLDRKCKLSIEEATKIPSEQLPLILEVLENQYLKLLKESGFIGATATFKTKDQADGCSFSRPTSHPGGLWKMKKPDLSNWRDVMNSQMSPASVLLAISEESINAQLAGCRKSPNSALDTWKYGAFFEASYDSPRVKLLSDRRAIFWIHIKEALFVPVKGVDLPSESGSGPFESKSSKRRSLKEHHRLAFEVQLRLRPADSQAKHRNVAELYVETTEARYLPQYSWPTKFSDELQSLLLYIKKEYLPRLVKEKLLVLDYANVAALYEPQAGAADRPPRIPELLVHPNGVINPTNKNTPSSHGSPSGPVLLLYQPSDNSGGPADASCAFKSSSWVASSNDPGAGFSHGTLAISKDLFLQTFLLAPYRRLNALTAFVAVMSGIQPLSSPVDGPMPGPLSRGVGTLPGRKLTCQLDSTTAPSARHYEYSHGSCCGYTDRVCDDNQVEPLCEEKSSCHTKNVLTITDDSASAVFSVVIKGEVTWKVSRSGDQVDPSRTEWAEFSLTWKWEVLKWDGVTLQTNPVEDIKGSIVTSTQSSDNVSAWAQMEARPKHLRRTFLGNIDSFKFDLLDDVSSRLLPSRLYTLGKPILNNNRDFLVELCSGEDTPGNTDPSTVTPGHSGVHAISDGAAGKSSDASADLKPNSVNNFARKDGVEKGKKQ